MKNKLVFVTVGTTSFDKLIKRVTSPDICRIFKQHGFENVRLQIGRGSYEPDCRTIENVDVEFYRYKDSLHQDMTEADLIISHAGAGSCLEALDAQAPLVVVVNEDLMDNHQDELASKLAEDGHALYATCSSLADVLSTLDTKSLKRFERGRPDKFSRFLDQIMDVNS